MRIIVNEIPLEGVTIEGELDPKKLGLDTELVNFITPVRAECFLTRIKDDLIANCKLTADTKETCGRCLTEFDSSFKKTVDLHYHLKGELFIEFDSGIRDEVITEHPIKVLCKEDCKGLCLHCGKNLNEGPCNCEVKDV